MLEVIYLNFFNFFVAELAIVTELKIALTVDFTKKIFCGSVDVYVKKIDSKVTEVVSLIVEFSWISV